MQNFLKRKASSSVRCISGISFAQSELIVVPRLQDHDSNSKRTMHSFSGGLDEFGDAGIRSSSAASSSENDLGMSAV
jgi:hypothetical protein